MNSKDINPAVASFVLLATSGMAQTDTTPAVPSDSEIRKILVQRIDSEHQSAGIAVGIIEPTGRRVVTHSGLEKGDQRPLTRETVFEIGSITKVFTSLLLADMAQRGEVALADPVVKYLPSTVKMPARSGRSITLEDLSTHASGLPRLPSNLAPKDSANPYADYSVGVSSTRAR